MQKQVVQSRSLLLLLIIIILLISLLILLLILLLLLLLIVIIIISIIIININIIFLLLNIYIIILSYFKSACIISRREVVNFVLLSDSPSIYLLFIYLLYIYYLFIIYLFILFIYDIFICLFVYLHFFRIQNINMLILPVQRYHILKIKWPPILESWAALFWFG